MSTADGPQRAAPRPGACGDDARGGSLRLGVLLTVVILVVEVVAGLAAHSVALLADAGHLLTDVAALGMAWFAVAQARRPADARRTYGYHRAGILVAMGNGALLVLVGAVIAVESARRLGSPGDVDGRIVVVAAGLAIAANAVIANRLHRHGGADHNIRAARLHVLGDLAASLGVVVAGLVILGTGWRQADAVVSLAICLLVAVGAARLVLDTVNVLLEGVPAGLDIAMVRTAIEGAGGVRSVHDLHVWSLASEQVALSCHVIVDEHALADGEHAVRAVEQLVCDRFGIAHTTIQVESCHPCTDGDDHRPGAHNHPHPEEVHLHEAHATTGRDRG